MTVWVRLICALLVLFMLAVYMGSRQIRSHKVNIGGVLEISAVLVVKGTVLPLFIRGKTIGILGEPPYFGLRYWGQPGAAVMSICAVCSMSCLEYSS